MEVYELRFFDVVAEVPWWWLDALLAWLMLMGLLLWLLGRKLARPALALVGLAVGAAVAVGLVGHYAPDVSGGGMMPWVIGGAAAGAVLLGGLLWRLALALVLTVIAVAAVPWIVAIMTGMGGPAIREPIAAAGDEVRQIVAASTTTDHTDDPSDNATPSSDAPAENHALPTGETDKDAADEDAPPPSVTDPILEAGGQVREAVGSWWNELETRQRYWLIGTAVGSGLAALLIGLAMHRLTASLVTALAGVVLMIGPVRRAVGLLPAAAADAIALPPTGIALAILLATLVGVLLQWIIFRKSTEK